MVVEEQLNLFIEHTSLIDSFHIKDEQDQQQGITDKCMNCIDKQSERKYKSISDQSYIQLLINYYLYYSDQYRLLQK